MAKEPKTSEPSVEQDQKDYTNDQPQEGPVDDATGTSTGTWVDDGEGLEYPEGSDDVHSGVEKLSGEERLNAVLTHLSEKHGHDFPAHIFDPKTDAVR